VTEEQLSVRESEIGDMEKIVAYFLNSDKDFLFGMGVDTKKLPSREEWLNILSSDFHLPPDKKKFYYIIWLLDNKPVGHSNINKIVFGEEAYTHLHLWQSKKRQKGAGSNFLKMTLPYYFNNFKLKTLYCEPSALNPAPNNTLKKLGFDFIKSYDTIPGWINFYQAVNRWSMTREKFSLLYSASYKK
jgi:RimJ/RimL family protein N-acetyltransferase